MTKQPHRRRRQPCVADETAGPRDSLLHAGSPPNFPPLDRVSVTIRDIRQGESFLRFSRLSLLAALISFFFFFFFSPETRTAALGIFVSRTLAFFRRASFRISSPRGAIHRRRGNTLGKLLEKTRGTDKKSQFARNSGPTRDDSEVARFSQKGGGEKQKETSERSRSRRS